MQFCNDQIFGGHLVYLSFVIYVAVLHVLFSEIFLILLKYDFMLKKSCMIIFSFLISCSKLFILFVLRKI